MHGQKKSLLRDVACALVLFCTLRIVDPHLRICPTLLASLVAAGALHTASPVAQRWTSTVISYYLIASYSEWFAHKYVMHYGSGWLAKKHLRHHVGVAKNMRLLESHGNDNFVFGWPVTLVCGILTGVVSFPLMHLWGVPWRTHFALIIVICVVHSAVWNTIHPAMHDAGEEAFQTIRHGVPSLTNRSDVCKRMFPCYGIFFKHHRLHHVVKKRKTNFNIVFIGMDRIMNTYATDRSESDE